MVGRYAEAATLSMPLLEVLVESLSLFDRIEQLPSNCCMIELLIGGRDCGISLPRLSLSHIDVSNGDNSSPFRSFPDNYKMDYICSGLEW